jgi:predicted RND superfamily exporter protein
MKVADIGSHRMDSLLTNYLEPKIEELFGESDVEATFTGTTLLFIKGNRFLLQNLKLSLLMAFGIIALIMALLFVNFRMILISLVPNIIPLIITAGVMGYFNIPLKPSTALIFSIAFGISVDDSIHFLAKYRQELFANDFFVPIAISNSIRETGASMMYTSIVLFFGFVIFAGSEFGGTVALGVLASATLIIAMFTNLIVLPSLLLIFDSGKRSKDSHPLIEHYDEFYHEESDEEIDMDQIRLTSNGNQEQKEKTLD